MSHVDPWDTPPDQRPRIPECGKLNIRAERCERCLFGRRPHIRGPVRRELIRSAYEGGSHFTCHEFQNVMCRGFYDRYQKRIWYVGWAKSIGAVQWIATDGRGVPDAGS